MRGVWFASRLQKLSSHIPYCIVFHSIPTLEGTSTMKSRLVRHMIVIQEQNTTKSRCMQSTIGDTLILQAEGEGRKAFLAQSNRVCLLEIVAAFVLFHGHCNSWGKVRHSCTLIAFFVWASCWARTSSFDRHESVRLVRESPSRRNKTSI